MIRTFYRLSALALFAFGTRTFAADLPMIRLQVQPVEQLHAKIHGAYSLAMEMLPFLGEINPSAPEDRNNPHWENFFRKPAFDARLLPGIDLKKPALAYGNLDSGILKGEFTGCDGVLMLPVIQEKDFLAMLKKFEVGAEAGEGGLYNLKIPNSPVPVFLRFHKGYACVAPMSANALDLKVLADPATLIDAKQTQAAKLDVAIDKLPDAIKSAALAGALMGLDEAKKELPKELGAPEAIALKYAEPLLKRLAKQLVSDSKNVTLSIDLDGKTGEGVFGFALDGQPGTDLFKDIAAYKAPVNSFGSLAKSDFTMLGFFGVPLFAKEIRDMSVELIDEAAKFIGKDDALPEGVEVMKLFLESLRKTVQSGRFDLVQVIAPPNKDNQFGGAIAVRLLEADKLAPAVAKLVAVLPDEMKKIVKLDAAKIGGLAVHSFDLKDFIPTNQPGGPNLAGLMGKDMNLYAAFGPEAVYLAMGADAQKVLGEAIAAKPAIAPLADTQLSGKHFGQFIKSISGGAMPPGLLGGLDKIEKINYFALNSEGGPRLKVELKTGFFTLFMGGFAVGRAANGQFQNVKPLPVPPR